MSDVFRATARHERVRDFRVTLALTYPFFLASALAGRLSAGRPGSAFAVHRRGSVFAEARAAAYRTLPYAF
ncbi:hypothetical protein [Acuticoccus sp.]|uniref:hypothetical protein n=1 Tax=Acuticoccus sp. TaxID=1904378 RepID=UPI003B51BBDC